ncbi:MFS transporter [candidate division FCPU426 bacterium]|nr:MFS transporter [candidate division FCPU426 bacterium]
MNAWQKNLKLVYIIRIGFSTIFCVPVITLFWKQYGLNLLDIFWLQAIFAIAIAVLEIPSGYLADRLGRKNTLLISTAIAAAGWLAYSLAVTFPQFVAAEIILGAGFSLFSGTDSSLVYESLTEMQCAQSFTGIEGRQQSAGMIAEAGAALAGGGMAMIMPLSWTLAATGLVAFASFCASWGITEPPRKAYHHPRGTWYGLYKIGRYVFLQSRLVKFAVPLMAACSLSTMLGVWLYQPLWQAQKIPVYFFGVLWAALVLPSALTSHFADKIEKKLGTRLLLWLLPFPAVIGYLILAVAPGPLALAGAYGVNLLRGLTLPVLGKYIHQETFSDKRATVLSIHSWLFRLAYFILGPMVGWVGKHYTLTHAFLACAAVSLLSTMFFIPRLLKNCTTGISGVRKPAGL